MLYRAGLIDAARKEDWSRCPKCWTTSPSAERDEVFATSLVRLLRSCPDERKWAVFLQALRDRSPLVRGAAAEALNGYLTPETLPGLLAAAEDDYRLVRVRAAAAMAALPRESLDAESRQILERATDEFLAAMQTRPDDQTSHHNLGAFYAAARDHQRAVECYAVSHKLDPRAIPPLVNASSPTTCSVKTIKAEQCLRKALADGPDQSGRESEFGHAAGRTGSPA